MIFDLLFKNIIYYLLSIHKKNIFSSVCRAVGILPCAALFIGTLEHKKLHSPKYLQKKIARVKQGQRPAVQCTSRVGKTHSPPPPSPPFPHPAACLSVLEHTLPPGPATFYIPYRYMYTSPDVILIFQVK